MQNISGIQFNRDNTGRAKSVTIDLEKYGKELQVFLDKIGATCTPEDDFEKKWVEGITGDELVKRVHQHLQTLPWKKQ